MNPSGDGGLNKWPVTQSVLFRHFGLPLAQTIRPNWQSLSGVAQSLYKRGVFTKSIPEETRAITVPSLSGL